MLACSPRPASSQVRRARCRGLPNTPASYLFAMGGKGGVGATGVLTREAPFRLTVANQVNLTCDVLAILHRGYTLNGTAGYREF
jgi:hypothetical protein